MAIQVTRQLALPNLVLCVACLCSCATGLGGTRRAPEALIIPFIFEGQTRAWDVGHSDETRVQRIVEYVRPGQTVENWTELLTVQTLNKAAGLASIDDQVAAYRKDLVARCPGSKVEVIRQIPASVMYESHVVGCEQGADEQLLARILDGTSNRFVVQYSVREAVKMTPERRTEWIEKLMAAQIMTGP